jgi:hypothetical protein
VDLAELYLASVTTLLLAALVYLSVRFRAFYRTLPDLEHLDVLIADKVRQFAFRPKLDKEGAPVLVDGKPLLEPNPELIAMAGSYVDAIIPVAAPKLIKWAGDKFHFDPTQIGAGVEGGAGALANPAMLKMVPKEIRGLVGLFQAFAPIIKGFMGGGGTGGLAPPGGTAGASSSKAIVIPEGPFR